MHMHLKKTPLPCVCGTLRRASRAVSRVYDDALAPLGLSMAQLSILRAISREPGLPLTRLAEVMVMDRTSLYRSLAPLEREGLVALVTGDKGRAKLASLTVDGEALTAQANEHWEATQVEVIGAFGAERWLELERAIVGLTRLGVDLTRKTPPSRSR